jgi:hypothetical protein
MLVGKNPKDKEFTALVGKATNAIPIISFIQTTERFTQVYNTTGRGIRGVEGRNTGT